MNKYIIFDYSKVFNPKKHHQLKDGQTALWSPDVEMLSPRKSNKKTPFPKRLVFNTDPENDSCDLAFEEDGKSYYMSLKFDEPLELDLNVALSLEESEQPIVTTPKSQKSNKDVMGIVRRLNFDTPEDYEMNLKSVTAIDSNEDIIEETLV